MVLKTVVRCGPALVCAAAAAMLAGPAVGAVFPPAGQDVIARTRMLFEVELEAPYGPGLGIWLPGVLEGPTTVERGDPYLDGGFRVIDTEIVSLDLVGEVGPYPASLELSPFNPSLGEIRDTDPDPLEDFPADSFFDIFFQVTVMPTPDPLTWLTLYNGYPHRMESVILEIPPDLSETPYFQPQETPLLLDPHDPQTRVGTLRGGEHQPEPATLGLMSLGAVILFRKRRG